LLAKFNTNNAPVSHEGQLGAHTEKEARAKKQKKKTELSAIIINYRWLMSLLSLLSLLPMLLVSIIAVVYYITDVGSYPDVVCCR
jgi:hypothetical protein